MSSRWYLPRARRSPRDSKGNGKDKQAMFSSFQPLSAPHFVICAHMSLIMVQSVRNPEQKLRILCTFVRVTRVKRVLMTVLDFGISSFSSEGYMMDVWRFDLTLGVWIWEIKATCRESKQTGFIYQQMDSSETYPFLSFVDAVEQIYEIRFLSLKLTFLNI